MDNASTSSAERTSKKRHSSNDKPNSMLNHALRYARDMKWSVFPIHEPTKNGKCSCSRKDNCPRPAKHPRTSDGFKSATTNEQQIREWWEKWPNASIGIATGNQSGIVVLDIDPRSGGDKSLRELISSNSEMPKTVRVKTGGGGEHFYFKNPNEAVIGNKAGVAKGIDVRGNGGYIIAPPSKHISGGQYLWESQSGPADCKLEDPPSWLLKLMQNKSNSSSTGSAKTNAFAEGSRNATLASVAGSLRSQGLSESDLLAGLLEINRTTCKPPLSDDEVESIVKSISRYALRSQAPLEWGEMHELRHTYVRAPELKERMIPRQLRGWIIDVCERMQVPLDFVASPVLVAVATVVGRQVAIRPKKYDDFTVISNLWGAVVALPASLKTPAITKALGPIYKLIRTATEEFGRTKEEAEWEVYRIEDEIKHLEKQLKGNKDNRSEILDEIRLKKKELSQVTPQERRFIINDATIEKIGELLQANPNGLLLLRDELTGFFNSLDKPGHDNDRAFFLESWNGNGVFSYDRVVRGTVSIRGMRVAILGGIQPARLKSYIHDVISNSSDNDGLIQRFQMLVYPEARKKWEPVDRHPLVHEQKKVEAIFSSLADLNIPDLDCVAIPDDTVPFLRFDEAGQKTYDRWIKKLENRLLGDDLDSPALQTHLGKYRSLMPTLALIFYLLEFAEHGFVPGEVPNWAAKLAVKWCYYLEAHAKKVYALLGEAKLDSAKALVKKVEEGRVKDGDTLREIYRHNWSLLSTPKELDLATSLLKENGWAQTQFIATGGAPTEVIRLNPRWLDRIKERADKTTKSSSEESFGGSGSADSGPIQ